MSSRHAKGSPSAIRLSRSRCPSCVPTPDRAACRRGLAASFCPVRQSGDMRADFAPAHEGRIDQFLLDQASQHRFIGLKMLGLAAHRAFETDTQPFEVVVDCRPRIRACSARRRCPRCATAGALRTCAPSAHSAVPNRHGRGAARHWGLARSGRPGCRSACFGLCLTSSDCYFDAL